MDEAIVDVALDLNLSASEPTLQAGVQEDMLTNNRDQAQLLAHVQQSSLAANRWPQNRAARVEALRLSVANGSYQVDSAELAHCILRNTTRFSEIS
jgi:anti-sigma28 factor (negative regulator of flagellin synthesis)